MFSIESLKEKARNIKSDLTFMRYIVRTLKDESSAFITVSLCMTIPGALFGAIGSMILDKFSPITTEQTLINTIGMGIFASYTLIFSIYKMEYKVEQKKLYTLSLQEMKQYLVTLPEESFKEKALQLIEEEVKNNSGKLSLYAFEKIYENINKEIQVYKIIKEEKAKKEKDEEITKCLMKSLKEETCQEKDLVIENKQKEQII